MMFKLKDEILVAQVVSSSATEIRGARVIPPKLYLLLLPCPIYINELNFKH